MTKQEAAQRINNLRDLLICPQAIGLQQMRVDCSPERIEALGMAVTALLAVDPSSGRRPEDWPPIDVLSLLDARIQSKLTPALNTGTALAMLILVGGAIQEIRAELIAPPATKETP